MIQKKARLKERVKTLITIQTQSVAEPYTLFVCDNLIRISALVRPKLHVCLYCCIRIHSESKEWRFIYLVSTIEYIVFIL